MPQGPSNSAAVATVTPPMREGLSPETQARWGVSRPRARMMEGSWEVDAAEELQKELRSSERVAHMGAVDISKCLLRDAVTGTSCLYDQDPVLSAEDTGGLGRFRAVLSRAGLWPLMDGFQAMSSAQREGGVRVDVIADTAAPEGSTRLNYRPVRADLLDVTPNPDDPSEIVAWDEYRRREYQGKVAWYRDVIDVSDPHSPAYRILDMDDNDASAAFLSDPGDETYAGALAGDRYPFRLSDGRPVIPGAFYHAKKTGKTWDPSYGSELVRATLKSAVWWTFWGHCVLDASWPQRAGIDLQPAGGVRTNTDRDAAGTAGIPTDPAMILLFRSMGGKSGTLFQFDAASDPKTLGEAIRDYMENALESWGIRAASGQRAATSARSGYAISLSNQAKRDAQRKAAPQYRRGDLALLRVSAAMWNRWGAGEHAGAVPEAGLTIDYRGIPLSSEEERLEIERWQALADLGVKSRVDLIMKVEGITRAEAETRLSQITTDNVRFPRIV